MLKGDQGRTRIVRFSGQRLNDQEAELEEVGCLDSSFVHRQTHSTLGLADLDVFENVFVVRCTTTPYTHST